MSVNPKPFARHGNTCLIDLHPDGFLIDHAWSTICPHANLRLHEIRTGALLPITIWICNRNVDRYSMMRWTIFRYKHGFREIPIERVVPYSRSSELIIRQVNLLSVSKSYAESCSFFLLGERQKHRVCPSRRSHKQNWSWASPVMSSHLVNEPRDKGGALCA